MYSVELSLVCAKLGPCSQSALEGKKFRSVIPFIYLLHRQDLCTKELPVFEQRRTPLVPV